MNKIIEVKDLSFKYDRDYIFENLNFDIYEGDFVGIIGANGAGKSTLIKLILGQLRPTNGSVRIYVEDPQLAKCLSSVGYVPQVGRSRGMDFPARVSEIVMMNMYQEIGLFRFVKKHHKEAVRRALEMVGMEGFENRKFSDLSGGQQQRVVIAKAIVNKPKILIMDEPTTGIDKKSEIVLYDLLKMLQEKENLTIVMISHDIEKIKKCSNKIVELESE